MTDEFKVGDFGLLTEYDGPAFVVRVVYPGSVETAGFRYGEDAPYLADMDWNKYEDETLELIWPADD